jgi:histidyl-tRNA synthetase
MTPRKVYSLDYYKQINYENQYDDKKARIITGRGRLSHNKEIL